MNELPWKRTGPPAVASPSREVARIAAAMLGTRDGDDGGSQLLVLCDPVLASLLDGAPIVPPGEWLAEKCAALHIPVPTGGDFPFPEGVRGLDAEERVFLTRLESLHLLGAGSWLDHVPDLRGFRERLAAARFDERLLRRLYKTPALAANYVSIHRSMMRRKWTGEPRRHLPGGEIIVYHHIPKCAGMSVFHHLNDFLKWHDELVHLDTRARAGVDAHGLVPFEHKDPRELDRVEVLFGHEVSAADIERFPNRRPLRVTCLRDPASRLVSHYNWEMHQLEEAGADVPAFDVWLQRQERNWMTRWLAREYFGIDRESDTALLEAVNAGLETFWIVCALENFTPAMRRLTDKLGLPPIDAASNRAGESYPKRQELTPEIAAHIEHEHPLDVALHRRWSGAGSGSGR